MIDAPKSEVLERAKFDFIRYAQCWEDPRPNQIALAIGDSDYVVSVASGGDNTFALLLDNPRTVVGLDISPVQIYLCQLKKTAIQKLQYDELLAFLGASHCRDRLRLFDKLKRDLDGDVRDYFSAHAEAIAQGILFSGKFERYFEIFRTYALRLVHSRATIDRLLGCLTLSEQQEVFHAYWDTTRWRLLFKLFFSQFLLGRLGRDPAFFKYVNIASVADELRRRCEYALTHIPIQTNYYIHLILLGRYLYKDCLPPYLLESNFDVLKSRMDRISFHIESVEQHLRRLPPGTVSKINFSNIFEYMSEESMASIFGTLAELGRPGMVIEYRNLLVPRSCPESWRARFDTDKALGGRLNREDRSFFYTRYVVERLRP